MDARKLMHRYGLLLNAMIIALFVIPWLAAPVQVQAQGNLLTNPNFEQPHGDGITLTAPPGWSVSASVTDGLVGRQLQRGQEVVSNVGVYEGNGSFDAYKGWSTYNISLYQTVSGITPGSTVRLSAFGRIWSCNSDAEQPVDPCITDDGSVVSQTDTGASFRVGIDPTGANDPNSGSIVWSNTVAPYTAFQQMTVDAAAAAGSVTVVLNASMQVPVRHQHVFWDAASLTIVDGSTSGGSDGGQSAPPPPAIAPEVVPQGPREDGSIVHTVRSGDTVAAIAVAYDITIPELLELNGMTMEDARFIYPGQELIIRPATGESSASSADEGTDSGDSAGSGDENGGEAESPPAPESSGEPTAQPIEAYDPAPVVDAAVPVLQLDSGVEAGRVCALLFEDTNPNRLRESGEGLLADGQIILSQGGATVESYTTDGESEPYCFEDVAPGNYMVSLTPPDGYGVTTPSTYAISVSAGQTVEAIFGAASGFTPPQPPPVQGVGLFSDEPGTETDTRTSITDLLLQYSGVIVLGLAGVVLVGGLGLTLLLRR